MKRALIIYGGAASHEPQQCTEVVGGILRKEGIEVVLSGSLDSFSDLELLKSFDVIIPNWTAGEISKEQCENLVQAVKSGVGLAGWHGGMCSAFPNKPYLWLTGGYFMAHPGNQKRYSVEITKPNDPLMAGIKNFEITSEQYYLLMDPRVEILASTKYHAPDMPWIDGTVMPVVWKTAWGTGRIFYSALGHVAKDFDRMEIREILRRGILWACR